MNKNTKIFIVIAVLVAAFGLSSIAYAHSMNKKLTALVEKKTTKEKEANKEQIEKEVKE